MVSGTVSDSVYSNTFSIAVLAVVFMYNTCTLWILGITLALMACHWS
jgi:hypothetical protein